MTDETRGARRFAGAAHHEPITRPRRIVITLEYERRTETVTVLAPGRTAVDVEFDDAGWLDCQAAELAWLAEDGPPGRLELRVEAGRDDDGHVFRIEIAPPPEPGEIEQARFTREHMTRWAEGRDVHPEEDH